MIILETEQFETYMYNYVQKTCHIQKNEYDYSDTDYLVLMQPLYTDEKMDIKDAFLEYVYYDCERDVIVYEDDWNEGQTRVALFAISTLGEIKQMIMDMLEMPKKIFKLGDNNEY